MDAQTIGLLAVALAIALGLVEVVKALVSRIGNGKNGRKNLGTSCDRHSDAMDAIEKVSGIQVQQVSDTLEIKKQVQDRDGVPLSFHMREQMAVSRAMLSRMEVMANTQQKTTAILEKLEAHSGD